MVVDSFFWGVLYYSEVGWSIWRDFSMETQYGFMGGGEFMGFLDGYYLPYGK